MSINHFTLVTCHFLYVPDWAWMFVVIFLTFITTINLFVELLFPHCTVKCHIWPSLINWTKSNPSIKNILHTCPPNLHNILIYSCKPHAHTPYLIWVASLAVGTDAMSALFFNPPDFRKENQLQNQGKHLPHLLP